MSHTSLNTSLQTCRFWLVCSVRVFDILLFCFDSVFHVQAGGGTVPQRVWQRNVIWKYSKALPGQSFPGYEDELQNKEELYHLRRLICLVDISLCQIKFWVWTGTPETYFMHVINENLILFFLSHPIVSQCVFTLCSETCAAFSLCLACHLLFR